jgi:Common central domain of tyrosinase
MKFWANIHGAPFPEVPTGPCEHLSEVIWPWHRAYLYEFETALRESHPPETSNVTLPYWNWTAPPSGQRFPKVFEEPGSPLSYEFRNTIPFPSAPVAADGEQQLLDIPLWETFGGRPKGNPAQGTMESAYHDTIHGFIGGHNSSTARSARDPIFWAHHSNLDRIWLSWQAKYNQQPVGANEPILGFPGMLVKDWNDVSNKYRYGPKVTPTPEGGPRSFTSRLKLGKREPLVDYPVQIPRPGMTDRVVLELGDIRLPGREPHFFTAQLYLHPSDEKGDVTQPKYFLGEFSAWDSGHPRHADAQPQNAGRVVLLDVTARARAILQDSGNRPLVVSIRFLGNIQKDQADQLPSGVANGVRIGKIEFVTKPVPRK